MAETARSLDVRAAPRRHGAMDLAVDGVACAACIRKIEGGLKQLPGVVEARLNFTNRRLAVDWREDELARRRRDRGARADRLSRPSVRARARRDARKRSRCAGW